MSPLQILLHITPVLLPLITLQIPPRTRGARDQRGTPVHTFRHALRPLLRHVYSTAAAVVDAADTLEACRRVWDVVDGVV